MRWRRSGIRQFSLIIPNNYEYVKSGWHREAQGSVCSEYMLLSNIIWIISIMAGDD